MSVAMIDMTAHSEKPQEVLVLLREEAGLYAKLETFSSCQRTMIAAEDTTPLIAVLADRQRLCTRLTEIAGRLSPIRRDWHTYRAQLGPGERSEADHLIRETTARLQRVIGSDEEDSRLLSARKQLVASALQRSRASGHALSAYSQTRNSMNSARLDEAS